MKCTDTQNMYTIAYEDLFHDIKTPMFIIYSNIQMLERTGQFTGAAGECVSIIKKCWFRMLKLVNDAGDKRKMQEGRLEPNLKNQDVVAILKELTRAAASLAQVKNIEVSFKSDVYQKIMATDKDMFERIVLNLLSNSIKFTDSFGKIEVLLHDSGDNIILTVKDNGTGISSNAMETIFERYRYVESAKNKSGSGIGLSIVREFTLLLGGRIRISSQGAGTEISIELPVFTSLEAAGESFGFTDFNIDNVTRIELSDEYY